MLWEDKDMPKIIEGGLSSKVKDGGCGSRFNDFITPLVDGAMDVISRSGGDLVRFSLKSPVPWRYRLRRKLADSGVRCRHLPGRDNQGFDSAFRACGQSVGPRSGADDVSGIPISFELSRPKISNRR